MRAFARALFATLLAMASASGLAASGSDYPSHPIQVYMPGPPGGSFDIMTRLVMTQLSERLGQPVIVMNVVGAGGTMAIEREIGSDPDGYHLVIGYVGNIAAAPWIYPHLSYDPLKALKPVVLLGAVAYIGAVPANSPYKTFADLVAAARAQPGKLNFASAGNGTGGHIGGEMVKTAEHLDMTHIPYQGAAPASLALLSGQVDWAFEAIPTSIQNVKAGKLRALAVTSPTRYPDLPDVPTMAELGYTGFDLRSWLGVMVPAGTPDSIVKILNTQINAVLQSPELKAAYARNGAQVTGGTPEQFSAYEKVEIEKYGKVIKASGAKAD